MRGRLRLELCERAAHVVQRDLGVRSELARLLQLVEGTHCLGNRRCELHEMLRNARIRLQGIEALREVLARRA
jgi:hypothetical protein